VRSAANIPAYAPVALGQMFEFAKLDEKAGAEYAKALDDKDQKVALEALARYVITLLKRDRRSEALSAAEQLATIEPEYTVTSVISGETYSSMTLLGEALFLNERLDDAEKAYIAALKILPKDPFVSGRLAWLYLATAKPKEAVNLSAAAAKSSRYQDLTNTLALVKSGMIVGHIDPQTAVGRVAAVMVGRPFWVGGSRTASLVERDDWT
jgi:Flp pilus assembly protein TadD